ncbi:MAG TPA: DUF2510 domain-containing protein [Coriobacteriia bacterium]
MMVANVVIDRPREVVWAFFTEPANWERWWGGAVKAAQWREGGDVEWALGGSSPITAFTPCESVRLEGAWMDSTFVFESEGTGRTAVRIDEGPPKGGASFKDGGAAHLEQLKSALAKLKDLVESETSATSEDNTLASPGTAPCPYCGGDLKLGPMALAMVSTIGDRGQASVQCGSCGASVTFGKPLPLDAGVAASPAKSAQPAESAQSGSDSVKAAWYEDPTKRHQYRYWDGACWTDHVADGGNASVDRLEG